MALLVRLIGARRCIEIGTYTGYSALAVALALPADGCSIACDVNAEWTDIGRPFWRKAGVESRIDFGFGPRSRRSTSCSAGAPGTFDFAFVDADKPNYAAYHESCCELLRPGGLIAVDNTLALAGAPIVNQQPRTQGDARVQRPCAATGASTLAMLTIGEGLTLLRKRG